MFLLFLSNLVERNSLFFYILFILLYKLGRQRRLEQEEIILFTSKVSYYYPSEHKAFKNFQKDLKRKILTQRKKNQPLVIVCIGTDRATGDCLGPLVGQYLQHNTSYFSVYGCLSQPVHAQNLTETIRHIYQLHTDPFIIAIDACLGCTEHIGYITLSNMPLLPGQGVSKKLPPIGNISITGIVNTFSDFNEEKIQNTRLHTVVKLASFISSAIETSFPLIYPTSSRRIL